MQKKKGIKVTSPRQTKLGATQLVKRYLSNCYQKPQQKKKQPNRVQTSHDSLVLCLCESRDGDGCASTKGPVMINKSLNGQLVDKAFKEWQITGLM